MKVVRSSILGFCFGVDKAISIAEEAREKHPDKDIYTLGPLLHNKPEVERLRELNILPVDIKTHLFKKDDIAIISAHGIAPEKVQKLRDIGVLVINATCKNVERGQRKAAEMKARRLKVAIVGSPTHSEVLGLMGHAGEDAVVIDPKSPEMDVLNLGDNLGVISQTTITEREFQETAERIKEISLLAEIYDNVCPTTSARQRAALEVANIADVVLVIGGKNSANSNALASICKECCEHIFLIEKTAELREVSDYFTTDKTVALVSGASTPNWLINEIENELLNQ